MSKTRKAFKTEAMVISMKKRTKVFMMLICLIMAMSLLLFSCGGGTGDGNNDASPVESSPEDSKHGNDSRPTDTKQEDKIDPTDTKPEDKKEPTDTKYEDKTEESGGGEPTLPEVPSFTIDVYGYVLITPSPVPGYIEMQIDSVTETLIDTVSYNLNKSCAVRMRFVRSSDQVASEWSRIVHFERHVLDTPKFTIAADGTITLLEEVEYAESYVLEINGITFGSFSYSSLNGYKLLESGEVTIIAEANRMDSSPRGESVYFKSESPVSPPYYYINESGRLCVEADPRYEAYELMLNGEIVGRFAINELWDHQLEDNDKARVRSVTADGKVSEWGEECVAVPIPKRASPVVTVDIDGTYTVTHPDAQKHEIMVIDPLTGIRNSLYHLGEQLTPYQPISFVVIGGAGYRESDPVTVEYKPDGIRFSAEENGFDKIVDNGDGTYTLTATSIKGGSYRFLIVGDVTESAFGWAILGDGARIVNLDAIHGILGNYLKANDGDTYAVSAAYELDGKGSISDLSELEFNETDHSGRSEEYYFNRWYPSYVFIENTLSGGELEIDELVIYFDGSESKLSHVTTSDMFYRIKYLPGDPFDPEEDEYVSVFYFEHNGKITRSANCVLGYTIEALVDRHGTAISDPSEHRMQPGDGLIMSIGESFEYFLPIVQNTLDDAEKITDAWYSSYTLSTGELNVMVVPLYWSDQADRATEENLDLIRRAFGSIMDIHGNTTEYRPAGWTELSLHEYYSIASYGKLNVNAFVADWYAFPADSEEMLGRRISMAEAETIYFWLKERYPELDTDLFDADGNKIWDEIVFVNAGDMNGTMESAAYAYRYLDIMGDHESLFPNNNVGDYKIIYHFINLPLGALFEGMRVDASARHETEVLIHEFGHTLGLADYYDTAYGGITAIGGYDMQDQNSGDWNVYSKYAVGWITPNVVDDEDFGENDTVTVTLRSSTLTGDALIVPARGYDYNGTPFDEYLIIDLFTPDGLHKEDSGKFGLDGSVGVRVYHVSDLLEYSGARDVNGVINHMHGVSHHSNSSNSKWHKYGYYQIEIISSTGNNHFTSTNETNSYFTSEDLFLEGDSLIVSDFDEFFYEGRMDNGMDFGYEIRVDSIVEVDGEYVATISVIRVTE